MDGQLCYVVLRRKAESDGNKADRWSQDCSGSAVWKQTSARANDALVDAEKTLSKTKPRITGR